VVIDDVSSYKNLLETN